mmetsp:Transcript_44149/g.99764  ORF Transcript_44149/g.99764 Transcript_44149/m.99764 type:complete len:152 (-) Transcript_44149:264-719(-)
MARTLCSSLVESIRAAEAVRPEEKPLGPQTLDTESEHGSRPTDEPTGRSRRKRGFREASEYTEEEPHRAVASSLVVAPKAPSSSEPKQASDEMVPPPPRNKTPEETMAPPPPKLTKSGASMPPQQDQEIKREDTEPTLKSLVDYGDDDGPN